MALNQTQLNGRITKELEPKYLGNGTAVLNFSIAVERNFKNKQGERETDFFNISAFGNLAESIANYFEKGDGIIITGSLQTRTYENNQGQTVYVTEVNANGFSFAQGTKFKGSNSNSSTPSYSNSDKTNNGQSPDDPFDQSDNVIDISDDDLPF